MSRALILVLDSLGIGSAADAEAHGDGGANTLGHVAAAARPHLPHLDRLGLGAASQLAAGTWPAGLERRAGFASAYAACDEQSKGKDTPSGHWEMAGLPVSEPWGTFPPEAPSFPPELTDALIQRGGLPGILGNVAMSGTTILEQLGDEHLATGKPIVYTSADSVVQIAAHETHFGLERLYSLCALARELVDRWNVGRIIARPFVGEGGRYTRTTNRRDWTTPPSGPTLCDAVGAAGGRVHGIGKIRDIFAGRGIDVVRKGGGNEGVYAETLAAWAEATAGDLVFSNFVDMDTLYGHRRDVAGYAGALEQFDAWVPAIEACLGPEDLAVLTADHGCDPTWPGTDHTRERVPALFFGPGVTPGEHGIRATFADIGQTVAAWLRTAPLAHGTAIDLGR